MAGFLSSLFSSGRPERELLADVILMTALADGRLSEDERDGLAHLMQDEDALAGLEWADIMKRADALEADAPLFSDARKQIEKRLTDPERQRRAIALAARIVGADRTLEEEEQAILLSLAEAFGIPEEEARAILTSEEAAGGARFLRTRFNDPRGTDEGTLFEAVSHSRGDDRALAALLFKPHAIRCAITAMMDGGDVVELGHRMQVGLHQLRVDATVANDEGRRWHLRCIAPGEALHADEHTVIRMVAGQLESDTQLVIVHEDDLSPADAALLSELDPERVVRCRID